MTTVKNEIGLQNFKNKVVQGGKPTIAFFSMVGCPHCDDTKEPWKKSKKIMRGSGIEFVEVDSEYSGRVSNMLRNSKPIRGFPTLLAIKGGAVIDEFNGERSHKGLTNFARRNFSKGGRRRKTRKQRRKRRRKTRRRTRRKVGMGFWDFFTRKKGKKEGMEAHHTDWNPNNDSAISNTDAREITDANVEAEMAAAAAATDQTEQHNARVAAAMHTENNAEQLAALQSDLAEISEQAEAKKKPAKSTSDALKKIRLAIEGQESTIKRMKGEIKKHHAAAKGKVRAGNRQSALVSLKLKKRATTTLALAKNNKQKLVAQKKAIEAMVGGRRRRRKSRRRSRRRSHRRSRRRRRRKN